MGAKGLLSKGSRRGVVLFACIASTLASLGAIVLISDALNLQISAFFTAHCGTAREGTFGWYRVLENCRFGGLGEQEVKGGGVGLVGVEEQQEFAPAGRARECARKTKNGLCVQDLFDIYDEAYREQWPGRVDLLIRSYLSDKFFLLELLLNSVDRMWPKGIGDIVLVLDEQDYWAEDLVPSWVKVFYEKNYLDLPGKIVQQWSYLWADNYTTAPFIAIFDDDVILNMKVTPGLLFDLNEGKPYVIASRQKQSNHWVPSTKFFVGPDKYFANFMVQLPFTFPRHVLPKFREHVGQLHKKHGGDFDKAMKYFSWRGPKFERTQIAHTTLGNYMWHFERDSVHFALEWTGHVPIPRVGVHVPYSTPFRRATNNSDSAPRVTKLYIELAGYFAREATCHAIPKGELTKCEDILKFEQRQIWQYVMDWYDWPLIKLKKKNATYIYDRYKKELHCMYRKVQSYCVAHKIDFVPLKSELINDLRVSCIYAPLP